MTKKKPEPQTPLHVRISEFLKEATECAARDRAKELNRTVTVTDVVTIALKTETDVAKHYSRIKRERG